MSSWAEIDTNGIVLRVIRGDDNAPEGDEGYQWIINNLGGTWVKTSYHANIRKNFAGIGFTYDAVRDAFIPPQVYASWILDETTCQWVPPIPYPNDGNAYIWDEPTLGWNIVLP